MAVLGHNPHPANLKHLPPHLRQIYERIQRKANRERRSGTSEYIWGRFQNGALPGAFPAISIGLTDPVEFTALKDSFGKDTAAGMFWLPS